jgi:beta-N-acetylhexosaminidase
MEEKPVAGPARPRPTPGTVQRRRTLALLAALAATALIWLLFLRGDESPDPGAGAGATGRGVSEPVARLVETMSLEERVDQVLLLGFEGTDATSPIFDELASRQLGGVLIEEPNWIDAVAGAELVGALRAEGLQRNRISPLIVVKQEGGVYRSLPDLPPAERELDIGRTGDPAVAERWAFDTARGLRSSGVDLNLGLVADVAGPESPVAGRAFSSDPAIAAELTAAAVRGCEQGGVACAALHFPGLGAASQDPAQGPATVSLEPAALADRDLAAFEAAFAEDIPAIILSLAFYASYDAVTPAAMARPVTAALLRDELGFEGAAITDDLGAGAVKATSSVPDAAVEALRAGADLVQIAAPADQKGVAETLVDAARDGVIPEERLAEAAGRVLELKRSLRLLRL